MAGRANRKHCAHIAVKRHMHQVLRQHHLQPRDGEGDSQRLFNLTLERAAGDDSVQAQRLAPIVASRWESWQAPSDYIDDWRSKQGGIGAGGSVLTGADQGWAAWPTFRLS